MCHTSCLELHLAVICSLSILGCNWGSRHVWQHIHPARGLPYCACMPCLLAAVTFCHFLGLLSILDGWMDGWRAGMNVAAGWVLGAKGKVHWGRGGGCECTCGGETQHNFTARLVILKHCLHCNKQGPKCQLGILSVHKSEHAIHIFATKAHWKIVVKLAGMSKALTSRSQPNASYKKTLQINQLLADAIPPLMS